MKSLLLLASASPRRQEILRKMGVLFEARPTHVPELPEDANRALTPSEFVLWNALRKAVSARRSHPKRWILAADTTVALGPKLLGKPVNRTQARRMLKKLSGQIHFVLTAVVIVTPEGKLRTGLERSVVQFKELKDTDITRYLDAVHVLDKAGAYALQEKGDWLVHQFTGSKSNVVGLPIRTTRRLLAGFNESAKKSK
jgi:septum formation protein